LKAFIPLTDWLRDLDPIQLEALFKTYHKTMGKVYKREISLFLDCLRQYHVIRGAPEDLEAFVFSSVNSATFQPSLKSQPSRPGLLNSNLSFSNLHPEPPSPPDGERRSVISQSQTEKQDGAETLSLLTILAEKISADDALEQTLNLLVPLVAQEEEFVRTFFHLEDVGTQSHDLAPGDQRFLLGYA